LNFLWLLSLFQDKESDIDFGRVKNEQILNVIFDKNQVVLPSNPIIQ